MRNERKKQIMTLSILVVAVLVISVGFAAFSATLRIESSATVNPDASDFSVKFSTTKDTLTEAAVTPSSATSGITTTDGVIDNSNSPTISNLSAEFKAPGDYVEYTFYVRNEGEYQAYLNNINFIGTKTCEAGEGATNTLVQSACEAISMTVSVAGTSYTETTPITGHTLAKKTGEEVKVRIEYASTGAAVDGPFTVTLPEITMVYSTVDDSSTTPETPAVATFSLKNDVDGDGTISTGDIISYTYGDGTQVGDQISIREENFYVINNDGTNIQMLTEYNLTASTTNPLQDTTGATNPVAFSSSAYWFSNADYMDYSGYDEQLNSGCYGWSDSERFMCDDYSWSKYLPQGNSIFPYVYDNNSNVYPYVEAYRDVLEGMGVNVLDAKLLSYEQAIELGCTDEYFGNCSAAPTWLYSTNYWLGSVYDYHVWTIPGTTSNYSTRDEFASGATGNNDSVGVRPVITISASDLG